MAALSLCLDVSRGVPRLSRRLAVYCVHHVLGITQSRGSAGGKHFVNPAKIIRGKFHIECADVFFEVRAPLGAGNGHDVFSLSQYPGKSKLRGLATFLFRNLFHSADQVQVLLEVLPLETRRAAAVVVGWKVFETPELAGEEAAAKRTVSDEADAEFAASREDPVFGIARPQRIFRLEGGNRMNFHGAAKSLRACFRQCDM